MSLLQRSIRALLKTVGAQRLFRYGSSLLKPTFSSSSASKSAKKSPSEKKQDNHYLLWYYSAFNVGLFLGFGPAFSTQEKVGRSWSYGLVYILSLVAILIFLAAILKYRSAEAVVASLRNIVDDFSELYNIFDCRHGRHQRRKPFRNEKQKTRNLVNEFIRGNSGELEEWMIEHIKSLYRGYGSLRPIHLVIFSQVLTRVFSKGGFSTIVNSIWTLTVVLLIARPIFNSVVFPLARKFLGHIYRGSIPRRIGVAVTVVIFTLVAAAAVETWWLQETRAARRWLRLRIGYCIIAQELLMAFAAVVLGQPGGHPFLRGCALKFINQALSLS
ncbi:hypothetical protein R1flu_000698 [Riccia fluitans]|uniref:Uncharacterized protein n=1 Tax=Riccia fluitans TaxID=41844 RepID=A0ABD1Y1D5_9MARC